jgi:hypothetical protein
MLHRAETSELGTGRDLALRLWRPVAEVGSAAGLTHLRLTLDDARGVTVPTTTAAGRPSPGQVAPPRRWPTTTGGGPVTSGPASTGRSILLGLPPPTSDPAPPTTTGAPQAGFDLRRPTTDDPLRVLVAGDSTIEALGSAILRDLAETGLTDARLDYRVSSGLARPDFFDWPARFTTLRSETDFEVVVIMLGANDAQPFIVEGAPESYGTRRWLDAYRTRVVALLDQLTSGGTWVVWVGQPAMGNDDFDAKMQQLDRLYANAIDRYPTATHLDVRAPTSDESGRYAAYLIDGAGDRQLVRAPDGVHLTAAGADRLAPLVVDAINAIAPLY